MGPISTLLISAAVVLSYPLVGQAQEESPTFENTIVPRQGRLFAVDIVPGAKLIKVSLVGKPIEALSSQRYSVTAETLEKDGKYKNISLISVPGGYQFKDLPKEKSKIKLKVQDLKTKESEIFLIRP